MWCARMRRGGLLVTLLLACAALLLWTSAFLGARALESACDGVSVRLTGAPVPAKKLRQALAEEAGGALGCTAAWTRGEKTEVSAPSMETAAELRVIAVYGDMRRVAPLTLLCGSFPTEDDYAGCLLDAESADALFHSAEITGAKVAIGGASYTVRGVASGGEPMALIRHKEAAYENLELAVADLASGRAEAEAFLYRHALLDGSVIVENGLYARILCGLVWLPPAILLLIAFLRLLHAALGIYKGRRLPMLLLLAAAAVCAAAMALLIKHSFFWPQAFLPTKCSDFAFWEKLREQWRQSWDAISLMTPLPKDVQFFRAMRGSLCRIAAAIPAAGLVGYRFGRNFCNEKRA